MTCKGKTAIATGTTGKAWGAVLPLPSYVWMPQDTLPAVFCHTFHQK